MKLTPYVGILGIEFHLMELLAWVLIALTFLLLVVSHKRLFISYDRKCSWAISVYVGGFSVFLLSIVSSHILGFEYDFYILLKALIKWTEIFLLSMSIFLLARSTRIFGHIYKFLMAVLLSDVLIYVVNLGFTNASLDYGLLRNAPAYSALFLICLIIPFATKSRAYKLGLLLLTMIVVGSLSRGAMLALGVVLIYMLANKMSNRRLVFAVLSSTLVGVVAIALFLTFGQEGYYREVVTERFSLSSTASNVERSGLVTEALDLFLRYPIFGIGAESFGSYIGMGYSSLDYIRTANAANLTPHNFFLQTAAEQGIIGLFSLLLWLAGTFGLLRYLSNQANQNFSQAENLYLFGLSLFFSALIFQLALGYIAGGFRIILGLYLGLVLASARLSRPSNTETRNPFGRQVV